MITKKKSEKGEHGELEAYAGERFKNKKLREYRVEKSRVLQAEQSNTSILYDNAFFLKLYRRLEDGINPDLEIGRF
jgi:maltose alpha-D-glucosyltransferase/alpha-amylase